MAKNPRTEEQKIAHSISEKKRYQAGKEAKAKKEEEASKKKAEKAAEKAFKMRESRAKKKAETEAGIKVAEAAVQEALSQEMPQLTESLVDEPPSSSSKKRGKAKSSAEAGGEELVNESPSPPPKKKARASRSTATLQLKKADPESNPSMDDTITASSKKVKFSAADLETKFNKNSPVAKMATAEEYPAESYQSPSANAEAEIDAYYQDEEMLLQAENDWNKQSSIAKMLLTNMAKQTEGRTEERKRQDEEWKRRDEERKRRHEEDQRDHEMNMEMMEQMRSLREGAAANQEWRATSAKKASAIKTRYGVAPMSLRKGKSRNTPASENASAGSSSGRKSTQESRTPGDHQVDTPASMKPRSLWVDEHSKENTPVTPGRKQISSRILHTMEGTRRLLKTTKQLTQDDMAGEAKRLHEYFIASTVNAMSVPDILYSLKIMLEFDKHFDKNSKVRLFAQSGLFTLSQHRGFLERLDCNYLKSDKKNDLFLKLLNAVHDRA